MNVRNIDGGVMVTSGPWGPMRMHLTTLGSNELAIELPGVTMLQFADALTQFMDRPVVEKTDLRGAYEVPLTDMLHTSDADFVRLPRHPRPPAVRQMV